MKILFIDSWDNVGNFFRTQREKVENLDNYGLYKNNGFINKVIRYIGLHFYKPFLYFSYGKWKHNIEKYDLFIIESRKPFEYLIKYINKKCPKKRIIVWYWNEITPREMNPIEIRKKYSCETWSFDRKDCEKYDMMYNNTYYFNMNDIETTNNKYDVFYIGIDREGRIEQIKKIQELFNKKNKKFKVILTQSPIKIPDKNFSYSEFLPYDKALTITKQSKVILDLTKKTQYGLTLRPVEALMLRKKLITDNVNIKEYDFYNKKNVFILGKDSYDNIDDFINTKYEDIPESIREKYLFENWLKRIKEKKEYN